MYFQVLRKCVLNSQVSFYWNVDRSVWSTESTQVAKHAPPPLRRRLVSASDTEIMFKNDSPSSVAVTGMWQKAATTWKSCSTSVCDNLDQKVTDFKHWQEAWSFWQLHICARVRQPEHMGVLWSYFIHNLKTTDQTQGLQVLPTADASTTSLRSVID